MKKNATNGSRMLWFFSCDTVWMVSQADDFFVCFWREIKQRPELEISDETGSWGGKAGPREARGWIGKGTQRGRVGKGTQRGSVDEERHRGCRERTVEGTSQDELAVQRGQRSAEGGSEEDSQRWVGIASGFCRSFAKNTLPPIVYKMREKLYKKVS